jgi:DNA-binding HxlR family transcriptional regulator
MTDEHRSGCPINLSLEIFGDTWSLLIVRDIMFGGKRHFRELLASQERISTNILADRLRRLVAEGILSRTDDPSHKQKAIYSLTEKGIALLPVLVQIGAWGRTYQPASEELSIRNALLEEGGPPLWEAFMAELREVHLSAPDDDRPPRSTPIAAKLRSAYETALAQRVGADAERAR